MNEDHLWAPDVFRELALDQEGGEMRRVKLLAAMLALVTPVVAISGGAGQTQGPDGSDRPVQWPGTAPAGQEDTLALPAGPIQEEGLEATASSYNASLRIPVAGLKPSTSDVEWHVGGEGGCTYASSGNPYTWWSTPLHLPQGSIIRYFRMYYNDQNPSEDSYALLSVHDLDGGLVEQWWLQSNEPGMIVTTGELDHVVDHTRYSYAIRWRPNDLGSDMQVCGFRVFYQAPPLQAFTPCGWDPCPWPIRQWNTHGGALKPRTSDVEWNVGGGGDCTYASSGDPYTWWSAPLYLPQGATIISFWMGYDDYNWDQDCLAYLTVYDNIGRVVAEWGVSSFGVGREIADVRFNHVVDYNRYSYVINWRPYELGTDMQVCRFFVAYHEPVPSLYMPIVVKGD